MRFLNINKAYDVLGRLTGYAATNESQSFQYDANGNGNRTAKTDNGVNTLYSLQTNSNRLVLAGNHAQTLDANGNLLNDGVHTYTYNAQNRLASVDGTTTYTYNADEQRVKKVSGQTTTFYAWDNDRIIGEYAQSANGLQASETIYMGSTPIALIQQGKTYRIHADQIDTPRVLSDASGKMVWSWESKPFGETKPNEDPDQDGIALRYNQRFPGQTYDAETGLHYNFHRDYNPQTGRYVQSDPIGLDGGLNAFAYVDGKPLLLSDKSGLAYIPKGSAGHGELYVYDKNLYVEGYIIDMPINMPLPSDKSNMRCRQINQGTTNVCAGQGTPPDYIGSFDGATDFFRVAGQWYKISNGHFKIDINVLGYPYIQAIGGTWPRVLWNADGLPLKIHYFTDGKPQTGPSTGIDYINRIKRDVYPWMPGI